MQWWLFAMYNSNFKMTIMMFCINVLKHFVLSLFFFLGPPCFLPLVAKKETPKHFIVGKRGSLSNAKLSLHGKNGSRWAGVCSHGRVRD